MKLRSAAGLAALAGLLAGTFTSAAVSAGPVATSTVAVFSDEDYTHPSEEDANVIDDLEAGGHTVVPIEDITAEAFSAGLADAEVLVIPELANEGESSTVDDFMDDLDAAAEGVISDYVDGGGRVLFFGSTEPTDAMNALFGFALEPMQQFCSIEETGDAGTAAVGDGCPLTAEAADTEMADGPAVITYVNDSSGLVPGSLPAGSTIFYLGQVEVEEEETDAGGGATPAAIVDVVAAASMPFGDGAVLFYGWDWFPAADLVNSDVSPADAATEADWATTLDLGVSQPEVTASSPAAGALDLTMDSPSTQPVFVRLVINGTEHTVVIAAKTTSASFDVGGAATIAWDVPAWGIGEGTVEVAGATAAPPAEPAPAAPTFTG